MNQSSILLLIIYILYNLRISSAEYIPPGPKYKCPNNTQIIYPCICLNGSDKGLYVRCENTNLASLSIALKNIAYLDMPIESLTLFKCNFERLYGTIFFKTKARLLYIEETPLQTIDQHSFYGINNTLQELHIKGSRILEFPHQAFMVLGNLTVLNIDNHRIQYLEKNIVDESLLVNRLEKLHLTNGLLTEFPIESFQQLKKLKTIDLHGNLLTNLKRNQFKNLREVEVLDLSFNNITKLESHHIADLTKLSWCNVSHNGLTEITRGTFARNSVIRVLNMSFNKIQKLDSNTFRGMRFLRRLYLNDNGIHDIGRGTFGAITRIGTIDLARNLIKKIDYQMFASLNYIEIINIAENQLTEIHKQSFKDLYLTNINISHNSIEMIENLAFENCANITNLDLSFNKLIELPKDTFDGTTYATELILAYNNFKDMSKVPLHTMTGMKILNLSYNNIEIIPKNVFPKLYELHTFDISHNNLSTIENTVFQPLFSLRTVNISHNSLTEIKISTFGTLPTILYLDLSYNFVKLIARSAFAKLTSLRHLNLSNNLLEKLFEIPISLNELIISNNWIQEIMENTWPRMNSLLLLDISGNRLGNNLKAHSFLYLITLQKLKLNSNGITLPPRESLNGLSTLQYLYIENNNITKLEKSAFGHLPVVFELNLFNNNIVTIDDYAFDGLLQLIKLNLSLNAIKLLPNEVFFGLVSLKTLDLSSNQLEKLDNKTNGILERCLSLEIINLQHNKFTFVTRKTFPSDPYTPYRLRNIDLSYNKIPILTYDITFGTKTVQYLNLSNNFISNIRKGVLENLTSLISLDLSNNRLDDLMSTDNHFNLPLNLSKIYLQNNDIIQLPFNQFTKLQYLKEINLRGNKLEEFPILLVDELKKGVTIQYQDNQLNCDCKIRPLQHYIVTLTSPPDELKYLKCTSPDRLYDKLLMEILDDQLQCPLIQTTNNNNDSLITYDVLPDIQFRNILIQRGDLIARWFVTPTRDVADFYVNIQNENNIIFYEEHMSYDSRFVKIPIKIIEEIFMKTDTIQLCVFSKNSLNLIMDSKESQCITLPDQLKSNLRKYNEKNNEIFTVFTDKTKKLLSSMKNTNFGDSLNYINIIYVTLVINVINLLLL